MGIQGFRARGKRKEKYEIYPAFRYVRNGVAHVELNNCSNKEYFRKHLGADFPDILNPDHLKFLRQESELLLREAIRIVEMRLADQKFWH